MVKPKKHLGQHFLSDESIAESIVNAIQSPSKIALEVGPGTGVLTKYLLQQGYNLKVIDLDKESIDYLEKKYVALKDRIIFGDFLTLDLKPLFPDKFTLIGNFPYNISSQIVFKMLDNKDIIPEMVGMFQKEVAERIVSPVRKKSYGILSVFVQAYYDVEYLFTVNPEVFIPPPKVHSAVIRLKRNNVVKVDCDEQLFVKVVKAGFNQRRKTLRNSLKSMIHGEREVPFLDKRAEELHWTDFVTLTNSLA